MITRRRCAVLAVSSVVALGGCAQMNSLFDNTASYQSASSTRVGCAANEVVISDLKTSGLRTRDWTATCKGQAYICSGVSDGYGGTTNVSCARK